MANSHFSEALVTAQEIGNKIDISYSLDGFAALAAKRRKTKFAARLAGVAEHLRESISHEIELAELLFRNTYLTELRSAMDETAFLEAYEQGRKLTVDEAIASALESA